jgi:hypothetical protein
MTFYVLSATVAVQAATLVWMVVALVRLKRNSTERK